MAIPPAPRGRRAGGARTAGPALHARIAASIEAMIASGALAAGARVNEAALAERFGVSRAPVREALLALEGRGVIRREPNRGAFVRELSIDEMLEVFDLRALLMGYAAERAAEALGPADAERLARMLQDMDAAAARGDGSAYTRLNGAFHAHLVDLTGNGRASRMYAELAGDLQRFGARYFDLPANLLRSNAEHRAMLEAIRAGDAGQARALAEHHIQQGKLRVLRSARAATATGPRTPGRTTERRTS